MNRILTWSIEQSGNQKTMLPAYYIDGDYETVAVRIYAETAPVTENATFEIYDDGVSIMRDSSYNYAEYIKDTQNWTETNSISLAVGSTSEEMAEDFNTNPIEEGSWLTCSIVTSGGAKNITVQLELAQL